jgi:hypothetical protein
MLRRSRTPFSSMTSPLLESIMMRSKQLLTMRNGLDLGGRAYGFIWRQAAFRIDEMGSKNGVDERRLSESGLAYRRRVS